MCLSAKQKTGKVMEEARNLTKVNTSTPKSKPLRARLFAQIADGMRDRIYEASLECDNAYGSFEFGPASVEVDVSRYGEVNVCVVHDNEHSSPLLEKAIGDHLPDWSDVEAEAEKDRREEEEFRDYLWRNCRYM